MPALIKFFYLKPCSGLRERNKLKAFLPSLFKVEKKELISLSYIFCPDDYLLKMNKEYLKHDYYTDIISFDLSDSEKTIEGEIYISIDRVVENAINHGVSVKEEIHRVIFHGALHLCGYRDKTLRDKQKMTIAEDHYLQKYFFSCSTGKKVSG